MNRRTALLAFAFVLLGCAAAREPADSLPSWNTGAPKAAVIDFVARVVDTAGPDHVAPADRIAVFDSDGTLIVERPEVLQFEFLYRRIRQMAPAHPEWSDIEPFRSVLRDDRAALAAMNFSDRADIVARGQAGLFEDDYTAAVREFLSEERHPRFGVHYIDLVYQPMRELVDYLTQNGFRVFIVSGSGIGFIREFSEDVYGVPRERVIGSSMKAELRERDGRLHVYRKPGWNSLNGGRFKALNIQLHIGRRPILAIGNSDGDVYMLRFAQDGEQPSLVMLLQHDDGLREYDYAGEAPLAVAAAQEFGWQVISMRDDFRSVFPPAP